MLLTTVARFLSFEQRLRVGTAGILDSAVRHQQRYGEQPESLHRYRRPTLAALPSCRILARLSLALVSLSRCQDLTNGTRSGHARANKTHLFAQASATAMGSVQRDSNASSEHSTNRFQDACAISKQQRIGCHQPRAHRLTATTTS